MSAIVETDWGAIYTDYYDKIFSYIYRRTSNPTLAEDLTSETFIKAIEADKRGSGSQSSFSGWIYRIAHNLIIDYYRIKDRLKEAPLEFAINSFADCDDPFDKVEVQIEFEKAKSVISQLTDDQQTVLLMRYLGGYEFDEIGQQMGRNRNAVKSLQHRALKAANLLLGCDGRPRKEPGKSHEIKEALCKHGPLTVNEIATIADIPRTKVNSALYSRNSMFCKIGIKDDPRVTIYIWGVIGIHDKEAA